MQELKSEEFTVVDNVIIETYKNISKRTDEILNKIKIRKQKNKNIN